MIKEEKYIETKTVEKVEYVTRDGIRHRTLREAEWHEAELDLWEQLDNYDGWFKVNNKEDLDKVEKYLSYMGDISRAHHIVFPNAVTWDCYGGTYYITGLVETYEEAVDAMMNLGI
mgnify:CR=1 FL=1